MVVTEDARMIVRVARLDLRGQEPAISQQTVGAHEGEGGLADIVDDAGVVEVDDRKISLALGTQVFPDRGLERGQGVHG